MKKSTINWLLAGLVLSMAVFTSCDGKDDIIDEDPLPANLEGLYIYGSNTVAASLDDAQFAKMSRAVLDPNQGAKVENMEGVYGKFLHIGANSTIEFAFIENNAATYYGAANGGSLDSANTVGGQVKDKVIHGALVADEVAINVTEEGLYYAYVNMNEETFILEKVKAQIIGDATVPQWAAGTAIPFKSSNTTTSVFEVTNLELKGATGYRYRFNDGWHAYADETIVTLSSLGVPSYGDAWDSGINDIGFYLENIPHKETGLFTVTLTYTFATGEWAEVKTKTGDLLIDYSGAEYGWFGNAYYSEGTTEGAWEAIHLVKTPEKVDLLYNWTWTLELIEGRSFVLRESPDGAWITYGGAAKFGSAFDNEMIVKEAPDVDNYKVAVGGTYIVTFTINSEDEGRILTIEPVL